MKMDCRFWIESGKSWLFWDTLSGVGVSKPIEIKKDKVRQERDKLGKRGLKNGTLDALRIHTHTPTLKGSAVIQEKFH